MAIIAFLVARVPRSSVAQVCMGDTSPYEDMMKGQIHLISAKLRFIPHEEVQNPEPEPSGISVMHYALVFT